ncbi:MAG: TPM domain-containing protein [Clostridia bacterium]|nr:TPM domain-containing protein [Clostridia bacterium]
MKRSTAVLLAALLLLSLLPGVLFSAGALDNTYYRYNDYVGAVSEENEKLLNRKAQSRSEELEMDFPVCVFDTLRDDQTRPEYADWFYEHNKFGYGENRDGILLLLDMKNYVFDIYYYGAAAELIDDVTAGELVNAFRDDCHNDDMSFYEVFDAYFDRVFAAVDAARTAEHTTLPSKADNANGMPYWYPLETEGFTDFHGTGLPLVVDDAEIFSVKQEKELAEKIREMNESLNVSYVALTADALHGLTPEEYASDFLHFNGYGVGERYGAVVFFLCLDMTDRCWLTIAINSYEDVFTYDVTYEIDELVDSDIRGGNYYGAFLKHADFTRDLFSKYRELPSWYPAGTDVIDLDREGRFPPENTDLSGPRVVDNAGLYSPEQKEEYETKLRELSQTYGKEFFIFTDEDSPVPRAYDYARDFWYYNGYGRDGVLLYAIPGRDLKPSLLFEGSCAGDYGELPLESRVRNRSDGNGLPDTTAYYLKQLEFLLKHGRLPMTVWSVGFIILCGVCVGLIAATWLRSRLMRGMTVKKASGAGQYIVPGSLIIRNRTSDYLYSTVSRTARSKPSESSSSSSSSSGSRGGSSYSSGRSAGGSYSGGGRRF